MSAEGVLWLLFDGGLIAGTIIVCGLLLLGLQAAIGLWRRFRG